MHKIIIISLLLTALVGITVARSTINLSSPDKKIIVHITLKNKLEPYPHGERIYYSITLMCDSPYNYRQKPAGLDFLKIVPTTWLETKVINASVGKYVTIARQAENGDWFIGSMTDWKARSLPIALDFLEGGKYTATVWEDADDADKFPDQLNKRKTEVDKTSIIDANLAPGGGHVVHIRTK